MAGEQLSFDGVTNLEKLWRKGPAGLFKTQDLLVKISSLRFRFSMKLGT